MLVYGDQGRLAEPREEVEALRARLEGLDAPGLPIERHARLAALFIAASELAQAIADAAAERLGGDGRSADQEAAAGLLTELAKTLLRSWNSLAQPFPIEGEGDLGGLLDRLAALAPPGPLRLKTGEGYAFYALYPEACAEAAARLRAGPDAVVVGVRSIGLGLAAVAAAALGAEPPLSVRPAGHPFRRTLRLAPGLEAELREKKGRRFVVVDEGPGLSGSSFGAVADALERLGAERGRIAFLPGHAGDLGAEASEPHRARWRTAERPVVSLDTLILDGAAPGHALASWFQDLTGEGLARLHDLSGGGWRGRLYAAEADWPACDTWQERRKLLLEGGRGAWLLKFAGLGASGERAFRHARALGEAGWSPPALALRHGFIAMRWMEGRPLRLAPDRRRDTFVRHLGRYLGWRAAHLPAPADAGATLGELREMAEVNAREALGGAAAASPGLDPGRWADAPPLRRSWTDNRLHAREWIEAPDGRWLKTDAVDHAAGHDLVGAQDLAWDVAGARVEFDLDARETAILREAAGAAVEPGLVALLEPAYASFQLGAFTLAATAHGGWPAEQRRLQGAAEAYRARLARLLQVGG